MESEKTFNVCSSEYILKLFLDRCLIIRLTYPPEKIIYETTVDDAIIGEITKKGGLKLSSFEFFCLLKNMDESNILNFYVNDYKIIFDICIILPLISNKVIMYTVELDNIVSDLERKNKKVKKCSIV